MHYLVISMCPCSLLEEQERSNSSSLMIATLPRLSWTAGWGGWTVEVRPRLCVISPVGCWIDWDWLRIETSSWRSNIGAVWEASLHTESSSACCWLSADRAFSFFFSSTTWTDEEGHGRPNQKKTPKHFAHHTLKTTPLYINLNINYDNFIIWCTKGKVFLVWLNALYFN